jgi:hypothetical protein
LSLNAAESRQRKHGKKQFAHGILKICTKLRLSHYSKTAFRINGHKVLQTENNSPTRPPPIK